MKRVGFTGTHMGVGIQQQRAIGTAVRMLVPTEWHHGVCVGADYLSHLIVRRIRGTACRIVGHPPENEKLMARGLDFDELLPPKEYKVRNRAIVASVDVLVAVPRGPEKSLPRSGTWYTVRQARARGLRILICTPSGDLLEDDKWRFP